MARKNEIIKTQNKDVVTSWIYTWSRQKEMSINEQRVILRIIEQINNRLKGLKMRDNLVQMDIDLWGDAKFTMLTSEAFFGHKCTYAEVKGTLERLHERKFEYEDIENKHWWMTSFIGDPEVHFNKGYMTFRVSKNLLEVLTNFTRGYRRFELNKALALHSSYALRFYMLMSNQTEPLDMTIESFKKWLGIPDDMYKTADGKDRINNIEDKILKPTMEELNETCPYSFTYEKLRERPDYIRSRVKGFRFYPIYLPKNRDMDLEGVQLIGQLSRSAIDVKIRQYFQFTLGFSTKEIDSNKQTIFAAQEKWGDEVVQKLEQIRQGLVGRDDVSNLKGYVISTIKGMLEDGVEKTKQAKKRGRKKESESLAQIMDSLDSLLQK